MSLIDEGLDEKIKKHNKIYLRFADGPEYFSISESTFRREAKNAGAVYRLRGVMLVNVAEFDEYIHMHRDRSDE